MAFPERPLPAAAAVAFHVALARRARREPFSHIVEGREFYGLPLRVTADVLDPRPDSETLIDAVLAAVADHTAPLRVLDLGTGSGCLLLALLTALPQAVGVGVDVCPRALAVAQENARRLGLLSRCAFRVGDWGTGITAHFDLVISNPPYIPTAEIAALQLEVALYEPRRALDGGGDGLAAYRALIPQAAMLLCDAGVVALELGVGQWEPVAALLRTAGLPRLRWQSDLTGVPRCVLATRDGVQGVFRVERRCAPLEDSHRLAPPQASTASSDGVPVPADLSPLVASSRVSIGASVGKDRKRYSNVLVSTSAEVWFPPFGEGGDAFGSVRGGKQQTECLALVVQRLRQG